MHDPGLLPNFGRDLLEEASRFESVSHFGSEDERQGAHGDQKVWVFGCLPVLAVGRQAPGADQKVGMRMVEHGARPGVEHAHQAGLSAQPPRIGAELLNAGRRRVEQQSVEELLSGTGQGAQLRRQRQGQQVIGTGQEAGALLLQPSLGLLAVALGTVPIAARVIAVMARAALLAAIDLSTQRRRAALLDGLQGPPLAGQDSQAGANLRSGGAENVRHLQHREPLGCADLKVQCQGVQRIHQLIPHLGRQVSVDGGGAWTAMPENLLNEAQLHPGFQQMRGVRMPQGMHGGLLFDPTLLQRRRKGPAQIAHLDGPLLTRRTRL